MVSLVLRVGSGPDRGLPIVLSLIGYLLVAAGAYVGGEIVYALGNMVDRHAWRFTTTPRWEPLDVTDIPEGQLVRANAGPSNSSSCGRKSRSSPSMIDCPPGGPLSKGTIVDGCVECPWHGSRFELSSGFRRSGPTTHDQPSYLVRRPAEGAYTGAPGDLRHRGAHAGTVRGGLRRLRRAAARTSIERA